MAATIPEEVQTAELLDKDFKTTVLNKLRKLISTKPTPQEMLRDSFRLK